MKILRLNGVGKMNLRLHVEKYIDVLVQMECYPWNLV